MSGTCQKSKNKANTEQERVNKPLRVKQKGQQKGTGGNTKSINDNPSDQGDPKQMRHQCHVGARLQVDKTRDKARAACDMEIA